MKMLCLGLIAGLFCLLSVRSGADLVGYFDNLDAMTKRSDLVLLIRIKEHVDPQKSYGVNTSFAQSTELCEVLKTFKGDVPENSAIAIRLFDGDIVTPGMFRPDRFRRDSCYVVFVSNGLHDNGKVLLNAQGNIQYLGLHYQGSSIEVSPKCDPKTLEGKSLKESLQLLIADYRKYREERARYEDDFFEKLLQDTAQKQPKQDAAQKQPKLVEQAGKQWGEKIAQVKPGMRRSEVEKLLPRSRSMVYETFIQGGSQVVAYWLDPHWKVRIAYDYTGIPRNAEGKALSYESADNRVLNTPTLIQEEAPSLPTTFTIRGEK
ncbi:MAG TPA: hypothetical protein VKU00_15295 [Chthonomonadaceae bacterium]|nr:hypothetical protein [Chthonomonadaceae bacterium]